jgi:hypothetical protein
VLGSALLIAILIGGVAIGTSLIAAPIFMGSPELAQILVGCAVGAVLAVYYVTIPSAVMERPGVFGALGRSGALTAGRRGAVFGLLLLVFLAKFGLSKLLEGMLIDMEALMADPDAAISAMRTLMWAQAIADVVFAMFTATIACVTYYLLRSEKEGTSADELASVFD